MGMVTWAIFNYNLAISFCVICIPFGEYLVRYGSILVTYTTWYVKIVANVHGPFLSLLFYSVPLSS